MSDVLFIKTSSRGDVIHHIPALTEWRRQRPDARFCWVVEEAFALLVQIHPVASDVISVASRRWRGTPLAPSTWREIASFGRAVCARRYDDIIDTQGLVRAALMARLARGRRLLHLIEPPAHPCRPTPQSSPHAYVPRFAHQ
jgi:lipopolysaccharide heptosyltransferase I